MIDFLDWWQRLPYKIDPVFFNIAGFEVRYYGISYLLAFIITYILVIYRIKNEFYFSIYTKYVDGLMMSGILGIFFGGRIGYVIIYDFEYYLRYPLEIILPISTSNGFLFTGFNGMSYHGGLIGSLLTAFIFTYFNKINFLKTLDLFLPAIPLGYTFGRLGNFINGELYGRETSLPIGMYFPSSKTYILRHPSQLYEAFFEGVFIFIILWILKGKIHIRGFFLGLYLMLYGFVRFFIEYVRQPDFHIGFVFLSFSMGQLLCFLMLIIGFILVVYFSR